MKKRIRFLIYLLLALLSLSLGLPRAAFTQERDPKASLNSPPQTPERKREKAVQKSAQSEQQVSSERKAAVRTATVNFAKLARQDSLKPAAPQGLHYVPEPQEEEEVERERPVPPGAKIVSQQSALSAPEPLGPSPTASPSFLGVTATGWLPPDTQGAAGPNHLVVAVNGGVLIQSKTGSNIGAVRSLSTFFSGVTNGSTDVFDPRVQYDSIGNRWILIADADRRSAASAILVGVSQTSDPTGNWNLYRIDVDSTDQSWADYPILGFNKDWIVISVNMFANPGSSAQFFSRLFVLNKANFYGGLTGNYTQFSTANNISGTIVPAATYDSTLSTMYLLQEWNGNSGGNGFLRLYSITGAVGSEVLNNTSSGVFISTPNPWSDSPGGDGNFAPQLGTSSKIQVNDADIQNVVYRNGSLWCTHTIFLPAGGPTRSSIQWWQINPTGPAIQQRGRIDDTSGNMFYAFPSIAVNTNNDVLVGYARFSATQYAGGGYAFRAGTDAANSMRDDTLLKAGAGTYSNLDGVGRNRWGDYSATVVDPSNNTDMWTLQEYATSTNNWNTWWGRINLSSSGTTRTLTVASSTPDSGVNITVTPNDNNGLGSGTTLFTRTYNLNTSVTLTAPATVGGSNFQKWQRDGADLATTQTVNVTMDADYTLTAMYSSGNSVYDTTLKAPKCGQPGASCDSGTLLNGRDNMIGGAEPNQPNTINNSCADGTSGSYHSDESLDALKVSTQDGSSLAPGKTVRIDATVWAYAAEFASDHLDLYYAADANNPNWVYITTLTPSAGGAQVLSTTYTLPTGGLQAVRGVFRYQGTASSCGTNSGYDDHDDLIFATSSTPPPTRTLTVASSNPNSGVNITVSPNDNSNLGIGSTQFTRTYNNNTVVSLTAPSTAGGNNFQKWQRDGADWATTQATSVTMDANHTMTAIYVTPAVPLSISSLSRKAASTAGGQQIVLTGSFTGLSTVTVGGNQASWSYTGGTTQITITTPAHAVGAVDIVLTPTVGSTYTKSNAFAYLPTVFTDDTLVAGLTMAKAQHILELRQAVDALRAVAGLGPAPWTDPTLMPSVSLIQAVHIQELRTYLDNALTLLGYSTQPYTDPSLTNTIPIKRVHIEELRQRIRTIAS